MQIILVSIFRVFPNVYASHRFIWALTMSFQNKMALITIDTLTLNCQWFKHLITLYWTGLHFTTFDYFSLHLTVLNNNYNCHHMIEVYLHLITLDITWIIGYKFDYTWFYLTAPYTYMILAMIFLNKMVFTHTHAI